VLAATLVSNGAVNYAGIQGCNFGKQSDGDKSEGQGDELEGRGAQVGERSEQHFFTPHLL